MHEYETMIHVFVGTKAQLIKMAPIIQTLDKDKIAYNFIDAGQHASLMNDLRAQFSLKKPDVSLRSSDKSITTLFQAVIWVLTSLWTILFKKEHIFEHVFQSNQGVCLVHGDTLTTLLSLMYAKRCQIQVAHVEAGLRSYNLLNPFPEEIIRLITMRFSDILFAPSDWAYDNLCKMGHEQKAVNIGANTGIDAVRYALSLEKESQRPETPYAIVTIHRVETIYSQERMQLIVSLLEELAQKYNIFFVLHEPTRNQLTKLKLLDRIQKNQSINVIPLQPYLVFINLIADAEFVMTDGGSIQSQGFTISF